MLSYDTRWAEDATLVEPMELVEQFLLHPPHDFSSSLTCDAVPAFSARFDLLTTLEAPVKRVVQSLPLYRWWSRLLRPATFFVGTTVSEYAVLPGYMRPEVFAQCLVRCQGRRYPFVIVKDLPQRSPLLSEEQNTRANALAAALQKQGFVLMEGQALAYVPIDFPDVDTYLGRLSYRRRKDIRRKLRAREKLDIEVVPTGAQQFRDPAFIAELYALYQNVFRQSEIHFDELSREFFSAVLQDAGNRGIVFCYRAEGQLIGYNLCFTTDTALVDKYVGFAYPQARDMNLYFVSWINNLEYALRHGFSTYVAGWTDPEIKAYLGAKFTMTQHAVYIRNPLLRSLFRHFSRHFEGDRAWRESTAHESDNS